MHDVLGQASMVVPQHVRWVAVAGALVSVCGDVSCREVVLVRLSAWLCRAGWLDVGGCAPTGARKQHWTFGSPPRICSAGGSHGVWTGWLLSRVKMLPATSSPFAVNGLVSAYRCLAIKTSLACSVFADHR